VFRLPVLVILCSALAAGCAIRTPADSARADAARHLPAHAWPARDANRLAPLVEDVPRLITTDRAAVMMIDGSLAAGAVESSVRLVRTQPSARGVIRELEYVDDGPEPPEAGERTLRFISSWAVQQSAAMRRRTGNGAAPTAAPASAMEAALDDARSDALAGVGLRVLPALAGAPRGYIICLQSLGGDRFERPVIEALRRRGWAVIESGFPWMTWAGQVTFLRSDGQWTGAARDFAERFDERLAEWAYAIEAALEYLDHIDPAVPVDRLCVVGFSAGAICGPTIAAAFGDRVQAVVLIGGGADILRISQTNGVTNAGLAFGALDPVEGGYQSRQLTSRELDQLSKQYLKMSALDPYHTAPALCAVPTLMLHAALDKIVPARCGKVLYERLGKPERWTFWVGHSLLFWRLPAYAGSIAAWVDQATEWVPALPAPSPPSAGAAERPGLPPGPDRPSNPRADPDWAALR
jgi:predicted esterase